MSLLVLENASKRFGSQEIFSGVSLRIEAGEKLGLIGRNGGGKSTLLRVLAEEEELDAGQRRGARDCRIGVVEQRPVFPGGATVIESVLLGMEELREIEREMREIEERLAEELDEAAYDRELARLGELQQRYDLLGGYDFDHRAEAVLHGLGFLDEDFHKPTAELSGGEKTRLAMARVLAQSHDLLLLDEPTNHMDLAGVEWLEGFLREHRAAIVVVSHDRRFLDRVCEGTLELSRGRLRRFKGNYTAFEKQCALRLETERREYEKQQAFIQKELAFIRRHMGTQRTQEAKGRQKRLERLERIERPQTDAPAARIKMGGRGRAGDLVLEVRDLTVEVPGRVLFENLRLSLLHGERVGVVGANGAGKTTLLRSLIGRHALSRGSVQFGSRTRVGYYDQEQEGLGEGRSILKELAAARQDLSELDIRSHLACFLFEGDEVDKMISILSGGERARVALAKLTLEPHTCLIMDEPTNHLDIPARRALESALASYPGAMLIVSHDRYFLDELVDRILYIDGAQTREYLGNYSAFEKARRRADAAGAEWDAAAPAAPARPSPSAAKAAPAPAAKAKPQKIRNEFQFKKLEGEIFELEEERDRLLEEMADERIYRDAEALRQRKERLEELESRLKVLYEEWENWQ